MTLLGRNHEQLEKSKSLKNRHMKEIGWKIRGEGLELCVADVLPSVCRAAGLGFTLSRRIQPSQTLLNPFLTTCCYLLLLIVVV
jgi:hypothetical protein